MLEDEEDFSLYSLNIHKLDEEWVKHIRLVGRFSRQSADAKKEAAQLLAEHKLAEDELELTEARIDLKVRKSPKAFGLEGKITEPAIRNTVKLSEQVRTEKQKTREVWKKVIAAKHLVDVLEGNLRTLDHRKKAIEDEVFLWSREYFLRDQPKNKDVRATTEEAERDSAFGTRKRKPA